MHAHKFFCCVHRIKSNGMHFKTLFWKQTCWIVALTQFALELSIGYYINLGWQWSINSVDCSLSGWRKTEVFLTAGSFLQLLYAIWRAYLKEYLSDRFACWTRGFVSREVCKPVVKSLTHRCIVVVSGVAFSLPAPGTMPVLRPFPFSTPVHQSSIDTSTCKVYSILRKYWSN